MARLDQETTETNVNGNQIQINDATDFRAYLEKLNTDFAMDAKRNIILAMRDMSWE